MTSNQRLVNPDGRIRVGVILVQGETELLDIAPVDMLHTIDRRSVQQLPDRELPPAMKEESKDFDFFWVSQQGPGGSARLTSGTRVIPTHSFKECPVLDIIVIGAHNNDYKPNEDELAFVRKAWEECAAFITICGGMMTPLAAGILDGRTATAPRFRIDQLRESAPNTKWVDKRWVRDGKLWTSSTLLNGADLMTAFIKTTWGHEKEGLVHTMARLCAWPERDVDFQDEK